MGLKSGGEINGVRSHSSPRSYFCIFYPVRQSGSQYGIGFIWSAVIPVPQWQEESATQTFGNPLSTDWIPPAIAGQE